ncbi:MAG: hypothetical protein ACPGQS_05905 [Bradymonadia bacterium]
MSLSVIKDLLFLKLGAASTTIEYGGCRYSPELQLVPPYGRFNQMRLDNARNSKHRSAVSRLKLE